MTSITNTTPLKVLTEQKDLVEITWRERKQLMLYKVEILMMVRCIPCKVQKHYISFLMYKWKSTSHEPRMELWLY